MTRKLVNKKSKKKKPVTISMVVKGIFYSLFIIIIILGIIERIWYYTSHIK